MLCVFTPVVTALLTYSTTLGNGFAFYDDYDQILRNPFVRAHFSFGQLLKNVFGTDLGAYLFEGVRTNYYRPLMMLIFRAECRLWGTTAWPYHLVSVALHALVTLLVFLIVRELVAGARAASSGARSSALHAASVGALLFAIHPLHTEAVAWLAVLPELVFTAFYLFAFLAYLRAQSDDCRNRGLWLWSGSGALLLACLAKEMGITLPLLLAVHALLFAGPPKKAAVVQARWAAPFWISAAAYMLVRYLGLGRRLGLGVVSAASWKATVLSGLSLHGRYWSKLLVPYPLSLSHPFRPTNSIGEPYLWLGLAALAAAGWLFWKGSRAAAFAILWVPLTLLPVLNVRGLGEFPFAERYAYLPSVGLALLAAVVYAGVEPRLALLAPRAKWVLGGLAVTIALTLAALSVARALKWQDQIALYNEGLERAPDARLYLTLARALIAEGRLTEAIPQFERARFYARDPARITYAHNGMGGVFLDLGNLEAAEIELRRALNNNPHYHYARYNMALLRARQGNFVAAREELAQCLRTNPYFAEAYLLEARIAIARGDRASARRSLENAVRVDPENQEAVRLLGELR